MDEWPEVIRNEHLSAEIVSALINSQDKDKDPFQNVKGRETKATADETP